MSTDGWRRVRFSSIGKLFFRKGAQARLFREKHVVDVDDDRVSAAYLPLSHLPWSSAIFAVATVVNHIAELRSFLDKKTIFLDALR